MSLDKPPRPPQNTEQNLEQKRIDKMFELITSNPDFQYCVSINGDLRGQIAGMGQTGFYFDQKTQTLIASDNDPLDTGKIPRAGETAFQIVDDKKFPYRYYVWRIGFTAKSRNNFTMDTRAGTHLSIALRVLKDKKTLDELGDEKLQEYLVKDTPEAETERFFARLLIGCSHEFIPEYWNFVMEQR